MILRGNASYYLPSNIEVDYTCDIQPLYALVSVGSY
jgi:hypothetical protein